VSYPQCTIWVLCGPLPRKFRKIFVGGIAFDVTNDDLSAHFQQFGEIASVQVKFDRTTGRSRGFAFVEFTTVEACRAALDQREQQIKNKACEIKPAKSREAVS
jgi:RNA recognition motif-containing protein